MAAPKQSQDSEEVKVAVIEEEAKDAGKVEGEDNTVAAGEAERNID